MSTFERCPKEVLELASEVLCKYENHKPVLDAKVKIDYVFALPGTDEDGNFVGDAIRHHGCKALGLTRKVGLKDRTMGRGDAEVLLDKQWWEEATEPQKRALLDHELTHLLVRTDEDGAVLRDDLNRPKLQMKAHDYEFGWFKMVAERHGKNSQERIQAAVMMEHGGQYFWPDLAKAVAANA